MSSDSSFLTFYLFYYRPIHILYNMLRMLKIRLFRKRAIFGNIFLLFSLYHIHL